MSKCFNEKYKKFMDLLNFSDGKHSVVSIFRDFVIMYAIAIKNAWQFNQEDEDLYLSIVKKYSREEVFKFVEMSCELVKIYRSLDSIHDVLGDIFEHIGANSKAYSQYFTPNHVANLMSDIVMRDLKKNKLKENEYISFLDPACGSGVLLINAADVLYKNKVHYEDKAFFMCQDIDFICVCMTYIQMSLYGMPGYVQQGDFLKDECIRRFYTPQFFINNWQKKLSDKNTEVRIINKKEVFEQ